MNKDIAFYESCDSLFIAEHSVLGKLLHRIKVLAQLTQECIKSSVRTNC